MNPFVCIAYPFDVPLISHGLPVIEAVPLAGSPGGTHAKVAKATGVVTPFAGARAISRGRKRKLRQRCPVPLNIGKQLKQLERQLPTTCLPGPGGPSAFSLFLQFAIEKLFWVVFELFGVVRRRTCVFVRAKRGRAASPLAAGNRNVQANVMGDADAIQPGLGETCVRTFPAPSSGMTDTGGQGLPALPIPAHGKSQGFT